MGDLQRSASRRASLLRRLVITFSLVGGGLLLVSLAAAVSLLHTRAVTTEVARRDVPLLRAADRVLGLLYQMQIAEHGYLTYARERYAADFLQISEGLERQLDLLTAADPERAAELATLRRDVTLWRRLFAQRRDILSGRSIPADPGTFQALTEQEQGLCRTLEERLGRLSGEQAQLSQGKLDRMAGLMVQSVGLVLLALLLGVLGLALTYYTGHGVAGRVVRLAERLDAMSADLSPLPVDSGDEIGRLAAAFNSLGRRVRDEAAASAAAKRLIILLQNVDQGLVTLDRAARLSPERSEALIRWLGPPAADVPFWEYVAAADPHAAIRFRQGWEQLQADVIPLEAALEQLPTRMVVGPAHLGIAYRPLFSGRGRTEGPPERILLVLSDISAEVERERLEAEQRDLLSSINRLVQNRAAFVDFYQEAGEMVRRLVAQECREAETRRIVHTLKGTCGSFGLRGLATLCHDIEARLDGEGGISPQDRQELERCWGRLSARFEHFIQSDRTSRREIEEAEYVALRDGLRDGRPPGELLRLVELWALPSARTRLEQLADQARELGRRLGKGDVEVLVEGGELRVDLAALGPFFSTLTHVVRNAVDHGLEEPEAREEAGKRPAGQLRLRLSLDGDGLALTVSDDGRGIDWARVAERARERGLPADNEAQLTDALFHDGLSTRDEVTETSGRGVGLGAVLAECRRLGGTVRVESRPGAGTTFSFRLPRVHAGLAGARPGSRPPELAPPRQGALTAPLPEERWGWLRDVLVRCWTELLEELGVPLTYVGEVEHGQVSGGVAAILGFSGDVLSGSVVLCLPGGVVERTYPVDPRASDDGTADLLDWAGELANQLVGRMKNRLLGSGVVLRLWVPMALRGSELRSHVPSAEGRHLLCFLGAGEEMYLQVEARTAGDLAPPLAPPAAPVLAEGELLLF